MNDKFPFTSLVLKIADVITALVFAFGCLLSFYLISKNLEVIGVAALFLTLVLGVICKVIIESVQVILEIEKNTRKD
jgi:Zn-dependent protease with chaperone function